MKNFLYLLTSLIFCLVLANCSLFGGDEKSDEPAEPTTSENSDFYEAGSVDSEKNEFIESDDDDEEESEAAASSSEGTELESDVAFGEPNDLPEPSSTADMTPDMTPDTPDVEPEPAAPVPTKSLASADFKQGMYTFDEDCQMKQDPDASGNPAGTIRAPKKLWVEPFDANWLRVYKKDGPVFISKSCLVK